MSTTHALIAASAGAALEPGTIERRDLRDDDVLIDIKFAGICHSDIHQVREEWGQAIFPMVPGHEIAGIVSAVGSGVTRYQVGDRVGVGCFVDSCRECEICKAGEEQYCPRAPCMTYNGHRLRRRDDHTAATASRSSSTSASPSASPRASSSTSRRRCCAPASRSTRPLKHWGAGPGKKVAIVGMGGLGHMGVKIAAALGAEVTVLSQHARQAGGRQALGADALLRHEATTRPSRRPRRRSTSSSTRSAPT